jgi:hypothetical protein
MTFRRFGERLVIYCTTQAPHKKQAQFFPIMVLLAMMDPPWKKHTASSPLLEALKWSGDLQVAVAENHADCAHTPAAAGTSALVLVHRLLECLQLHDSLLQLSVLQSASTLNV